VGEAAAQSAALTPALPEGSSSLSKKPGWATKRFVVAAANPLAVQAGYQILRAGGSAVDAAVAVQNGADPGRAPVQWHRWWRLLLHFNGQQTEAFDGRETAPAAVNERLFMGQTAKP